MSGKQGTGASEAPEEMSRRLALAMNKHGYGLQYSVLRRLESLAKSGLSTWVFEAAEVPVTISGHDTRVDFVLRTPDHFGWLVAECKRVDPALGHWCFARAPYTIRNEFKPQVILEGVTRNTQSYLTSAPFRPPSIRTQPYHVSVEVPSSAKGDGTGAGRDNIEKAVTQLLRGVSGLIELFAARNSLLGKGKHACFVPMLVTTANLWVTDLDLGSASLDFGTFDPSEVNATQADWLWYQYTLSPSLRHGAVPDKEGDELHKVIGSEFTRSVAIVHAEKLESFLSIDIIDWTQG